MTPREKFLGLIKNDILRLGVTELDFSTRDCRVGTKKRADARDKLRVFRQHDPAGISKRLNKLKDCL